ncbi:myosin heavy chain, skeletal muscle, adult-like [Achroia grisella]|uniref:myosin heavy chain, skeletal muscle, adult-like n=1 Tax=Achroia grisella TaxID=688607 RepID=UPI0027D27FCB|nr:myosin heavy chain, skeletal muscle, adult-like [Achroia grisella]
MDFNEITEAASRKRLNADAEKLRENVSREAAKIIKLKVAQDTAYWDLKEKLHQVESNHERLQQNMVEVQMQHEAISGQYQDELRLRPDTLNKLSSTREICDVLENYTERLKDTLARCKADQASLYDAYQRSGQVVRELKLQHTQLDEKNRQKIESIVEKAKLSSEHQTQMIQYLNESKQKADRELTDTKVQLATVQAQKDDLSTAVGEIRNQLEHVTQEVNMKDVALIKSQKDMKQLVNEFTTQSNEVKNAYMKKEEQLKQSLEEIEALKGALSNQEAFTDSVRKQNDFLQEQVAAAEERHAASTLHIEQLQVQLEDARITNDNNKEEIMKLQDKVNHSEKENDEKYAVILMKESEINNLQLQVNNLETEKAAIISKLETMTVKINAEEALVAELTAANQMLTTNLGETENALKTHKDASDARIAELTTSMQSKDKELDSKAGTIAQLMCEVTTAVDTSAKLETALHKLRKEMELEKESGREKERKYGQQVERLEGLLREKDDESSKQMSIILEIRAEKERLQEKFQSLQTTMDNIQKQLSGPQPPPKPREAPEHDDNARPFASQPLGKHTTKNITKPVMTRKPADGDPGAINQQVDSILFSLFSDNSMDDGGDANEPREVRRFEAPSRGQSAPAILKRRAGVPAARPRVIVPEDDDDNAIISLSQVRNKMKDKNQRTFFKSKRETKRPK